MMNFKMIEKPLVMLFLLCLLPLGASAQSIVNSKGFKWRTYHWCYHQGEW